MNPTNTGAAPVHFVPQRWFRFLAVLLILTSLPCVVRAQLSAVRFNEILASNTQRTNVFGGYTAMIELFNPGLLPADLEGYIIGDSQQAYSAPYLFPPGMIIAPGGYLVLACDLSLTNQGGLAVPLNIPAYGGFLYLVDSEGFTIDAVPYGLQVQDRSLVRMDPETWGLGVPSLGATNTALPLGDPQALRINEWLANRPDGGTDYFELYNSAGQPVALGGLYLSRQESIINQYAVTPLSFIGTGAQAYVTFFANGEQNLYGTNPANTVGFVLRVDDDEAGSIYLRDTSFQEIHHVNYFQPVENVSEGLLPDGNTNRIVSFPRINDYQTRSPGEPNFLLLTNLFVNELLSNPVLVQEDAVEFINVTGTNINIGGWWLSNKRNQPRKYLIPPGTMVPAHGLRTIYEGDGAAIGFNSSSAAVPFQFSGLRGGEVVLSATDGNGNLTGYRAYETFESSAPGVSFGHVKTSVPEDYKFVATTQPTFGADNAGTVAGFRAGAGLSNAPPKFGPVVISEVSYHPSNSIYFVFTNGSTIPVYGPNPIYQFIELHNTGNQPVPLYDPAIPTNRWRLQNAVQYDFPQTILAPGAYCVIVSFAPTNRQALTNFCNRYQISTNSLIFGPWTGTLEDNVGAVELYRPGVPDSGYIPYYRVDKVKYGAAYVGGLQRWPRLFGDNFFETSLQRKDEQRFGNDPFNWAAASRPTPVGPAPASIQDTDWDGLPDVWETQYGFNPTNASDALLDPDQDRSNNLEEFTAGSNPTNALSALRVLQVELSTTNMYWPRVLFTAYSNTSYRLEYRDTITSPWIKASDISPGRTNQIENAYDYEWDIFFAGSQRYYRIVAPATN